MVNNANFPSGQVDFFNFDIVQQPNMDSRFMLIQWHVLGPVAIHATWHVENLCNRVEDPVQIFHHKISKWLNIPEVIGTGWGKKMFHNRLEIEHHVSADHLPKRITGNQLKLALIEQLEIIVLLIGPMSPISSSVIAMALRPAVSIDLVFDQV